MRWCGIGAVGMAGAVATAWVGWAETVGQLARFGTGFMLDRPTDP